MSAHPRLSLGGLPVDRLDMHAALERMTSLVEAGKGGTVFTPNVDHVVLATEDAAFLRAYAAVDLSLADGMPVVWASRLLGEPLPEKISGADLVGPLLALSAAKGWRVYLLGGREGVAVRAADALVRRHPALAVVGAAGPRVDLSEPASARAQVIADIRAAAPDIVLVCFGAPKQELWIHESAAALRPAVLLGVGASIDFLAGTSSRAPAWMSASGLEWAYRLAHEPRRLWRRYLVHDRKFVGIVARELLQRAESMAAGREAPP